MGEPDGIEKTLALQRSLNKFIDTVNSLQNEDDPSGDGFTREFRTIREHGIRMKEENRYPAEEGKKSVNVKKNRYRDILPFDDTRVELDKVNDEEGSDYINANFIKNHNGVATYIASQGPLPHTVNDFWRMIMQFNVKVIVMACLTVEMGRRKCEQYWPDEEDGGSKTQQFGDVTVTMTLEYPMSENCVKRVLQAVQGNNSLTVTQFHYTYWPDHDIPKDFDEILEMMAEIRQIRAEDREKSPMLVHCSAGCGRTGTICAIDFAWELLRTGCLTENFSLYDIVMEMRTQRQSMIQAPEQYMMAHVIIRQLFEKHLAIMDDHTYGNFEFHEGQEGKEETSSISSDKSSHRKNSMLQQLIEVTLKNVSGDEASLESRSLSQEQGVPPISPIQEEPVKSPGVKQMTAVFNNEKVNNNSTTTPTTMKQTLKSQTSIASDGSKKHVTVLSIGSTGSKQPLSQTKSHPAVAGNKPATSTIDSNRAKTYPNVKEKPQSSIPPSLPTQTTVYSLAKSEEVTSATDASYSALSNYSSMTQNNNASPAMYHVLEKQASANGVTGNQQSGALYAVAREPDGSFKVKTCTAPTFAGNQSGAVYSVAKDPDNLYTAVEKPKGTGVPIQNGQMDAVYETVDMKVPPPIPSRGYLEDEPNNNNNNNNRERPPIGGGGNTQTLGRKMQFIKMFNKTPTGTDSHHPSGVPGFKEKIGGKPKGPRPPIWKKK